ncbi:MAG: thiamine-phosphate kinase [Pseudomonadota bacterium]
MASEFDLIARYFTRPARTAILGVGDDAALLRPSPGRDLAISADMLVAGRHFFPETDPEGLGHKALAVNLSDLAAMGATPRWALLSLALPGPDEAWLAAFARGFHALADQQGVELVGGDTTGGPLNINVTILGEIPAGQALRRDGARVGDDLWVSGELGGAALALRQARGELSLPDPVLRDCRDRLDRPTPRVALGLALRGIAHAAIDVSDGLLADVGHVLARSGVAAEIWADRVPVAWPGESMALSCALTGGDDYELCFTAAPEQAEAVRRAGHEAGIAVTPIGRIVTGTGLVCRGAEGEMIEIEGRGFDHFAA